MSLYKTNGKFSKPLVGGGVGIFYNVSDRFRALLSVSYLESSESFKNSSTTTLTSQVISFSPEIAYTFYGSSEDSRLSLSALVGANLDFNLLKADFLGEFPITDNYGNPNGSIELKYSRSEKYTPLSPFIGLDAQLKISRRYSIFMQTVYSYGTNKPGEHKQAVVNLPVRYDPSYIRVMAGVRYSIKKKS